MAKKDVKQKVTDVVEDVEEVTIPKKPTKRTTRKKVEEAVETTTVVEKTEVVETKEKKQMNFRTFQSKSTIALSVGNAITIGCEIRDKYKNEIESSIDARTQKRFITNDLLNKIFQSDDTKKLDEIIEIFKWRLAMRNIKSNLVASINKQVRENISAEILTEINNFGKRITNEKCNTVITKFIGKVIQMPFSTDHGKAVVTNVIYACNLVDRNASYRGITDITLEEIPHEIKVNNEVINLPIAKIYDAKTNDPILTLTPCMSVIELTELQNGEDGKPVVMEKSINISDFIYYRVLNLSLKEAIMMDIIGLV